MGWLTETGRVVALESDAVWVEADRSAACGKCAARAGCGQGALSALLQSGKGRVRVTSGDTLDAASCQLGDEVLIQVPESTLLDLIPSALKQEHCIDLCGHTRAGDGCGSQTTPPRPNRTPSFGSSINCIMGTFI